MFFRYPTENNASKSSNKPVAREQIAAWDKDRRGDLKAFVVLVQNDEIVKGKHPHAGTRGPKGRLRVAELLLGRTTRAAGGRLVTVALGGAGD